MDRLQKQIIGRNPPILHGEYYPPRIVLSSADNRSPPYEEPGGTCALGDGGMLYPDLANGDQIARLIGKWGRMHMKYTEKRRLSWSPALFAHEKGCPFVRQPFS